MCKLKNEELIKLIDSYELNKNKKESYESICKKENEQIKTEILARKKKEFNGTNIKAVVSISEKTSVNEDALLKVLKECGIDSAIKKVEVVDSDVLEKMIYNGELSDEVQKKIASCTSVTPVKTLRLYKKKGE